jgi:hypothetical protein
MGLHGPIHTDCFVFYTIRAWHPVHMSPGSQLATSCQVAEVVRVTQERHWREAGGCALRCQQVGLNVLLQEEVNANEMGYLIVRLLGISGLPRGCI